MILAFKFTFRGVYLLKVVIELVPKTYSMKLSEFGSVSQRPQLINKKTSAGDTPVVSLNRDKLEFTVNFMESNCVQFLSMGERLEVNKLWEISERSEYHLTKFLAPPVSTCLSCGGNITMHNWPTRARLFSLEGPVPASNIALECRNCKISYGIARYTHDDKSHYYPKTLTRGIIEVSNTTYMSERPYKWIPSLR